MTTPTTSGAINLRNTIITSKKERESTASVEDAVRETGGERGTGGRERGREGEREREQIEIQCVCNTLMVVCRKYL